MAEEIIAFVRESLERMKKQSEEVAEAIRLGEAMGIDVTAQKAELERLKRQIERYEKGFTEYLKKRGLRQ